MLWDHQAHPTHPQDTRKNRIPCNKMAKCVNDHENAPIHYQQFSINVNTEHKPTAEN